MKKRLLSIILAVTFATMSLSACGQKTETIPKQVFTPEPEITDDNVNDPPEFEVEPAEEAPVNEEDDSQLIAWHNSDMEALVKSILKKDEVTVGDAKSMTELSSNGKYTIENKDMSDLRYFTGLTKLAITCDSLDDLSFVNDLQNLQELCIDSEHLTTLESLDDNENLKAFELITYGLESLDGISKLHNLEKLEVYTDILSDISDASELTSLKEIKFVSNTLKNPNIDMSKMSKLNDIELYGKYSINNTDFLSTIAAVELPEDSNQIYIKLELSSELSDEELNKTATVLAEKIYDIESFNNKRVNCVPEILLPREDGRYFGNFLAEAYNSIVESKGSPIHANVEAIDQTTDVKVPDNWEEMTFALGGQIITLSTSVTPQTYLDYGFTLLNGNISYEDFHNFNTKYSDVKFDDMIEPMHESDAFQMINTDTGAVVGLRVRNLSEERACELRDCAVISITVIKDVYHKVGSVDAKRERQPELVLPTNEAYIQEQKKDVEREIQENGEGDQTYLTFGSWDSDYSYTAAFDFNTGSVKQVVKDNLDAEVTIGFGDEGIDIIELKFVFK